MLCRLPKSVRGRFIMISSLLTASVFVVFVFFSVMIISSAMKTKEQAYMDSSLKVLTRQMDQEYRHIMQITQHMTSNGAVGKQLNKMLSTKTTFDLSEEQRQYESILQTITAIGNQVEIAMYYDCEADVIHSSTFPVKKSFSLTDGVKLVRRTNSVSFHALHTSQSRFSNHPVLSIAWPSTYINDKRMTVYVEVRSSVPALFAEINRSSESDYVLLQVSEDGRVCYSSDPSFAENEEIAQMIASEETSGFTSRLMWCKDTSDYLFNCILFQPKQMFYRSMFSWLDNMLVALGVTVGLLVISIILFNRMILGKLNLMMQAVDAVQRPQLFITTQRTGLSEFDKLMDHFSKLLGNIRQLLDEIKANEKEKLKLELEKLYYQINPHFLMNSLNTLYWMARLNQQNDISEFSRHLMGILSYSLGKTAGEPTIRRELDVIHDYIALEQERHTFNAIFEVEEGSYLDMPMPKLFLQPLVENAVNHGIGAEGTLRIQARPVGSGVLIVVEDDGCGIEPQKLEQLQTMEGIRQNGGIGLRYSVSMLRQFFGDGASIRITNGETSGTKVTITLNLWKEDPHDKGIAH